MTDPQTPAIFAAVNAPHQFSYENGIVVTEARADYGRGVLTVGPDSINPHGQVHGGALATLADTVAGTCACAPGGSCVTSGCSMEFLRPALGPEIVCEAVPKKRGRHLCVVAVTLTNAVGKVVCTGTYTFYMLPES